MLWMFLSGFLFVQAHPTEVEIESGETQEITVRAATVAGEIEGFQIEAQVIPPERGSFQNGKFVAGEPGPGLIVFKVKYKGEIGVEAVPIRVLRPTLGLSPKKAVLQVGDTLRFSVKAGVPEIWRVMPPWLGTIENGVFVAQNPGRGVVTLKTDQGFSKAKVVVEGQESEMTDLFPSEALLFPGESVSFSVSAGASFSLDPPDLATVKDGVLTAKRPGNGLVWATWEEDGQRKTAKAFVRVLPAIFLRPGQTMRIPIPGRARKCAVKVEGQGLSVKTAKGTIVLRGVEEGHGIITILRGRRSRKLPFIVGKKLISIGPREIKLAPGEEFKPGVLSSVGGGAEVDLVVMPPEAGRVQKGVFHASDDWRGEAWLLGITPSGAGGFVHLIITPNQ